jgi:hypothetical protein
MSSKAFFAILILVLLMTGGYFLLTRNTSGPAPVSDPGIVASSGDVENFVRHDFLKLLSLDGQKNDEQHLQESSPYMTEAGLQSLRANYMQSDWMKSTERTEVKFLSQPKVTGRSDVDGQAFWNVVSRVEIGFFGGGAKSKGIFDVTLSVTTKQLNGEDTFGIDAMTLSPVGDVK